MKVASVKGVLFTAGILLVGLALVPFVRGFASNKAGLP
jgi:hypothetical protein